jgi:hypothetical protein
LDAEGRYFGRGLRIDKFPAHRRAICQPLVSIIPHANHEGLAGNLLVSHQFNRKILNAFGNSNIKDENADGSRRL